MVQYKSQQIQIRVLPSKTAEEILARERERKAKTTLLISIPEDHLAKFQKMSDAKEMWEAIKSRFGGNDESKKMQKYILKQQFESFFVSNSEGLHKGYDRFQSLLSQLEIHGAGVSTEDANKKFLRSLPASWSQVSLIMRTKPGVYTLSLMIFITILESLSSMLKALLHHLPAHRMWRFVSSESTSSTNDVDEFDLEEMDLKWQVAMISTRLKKFYKKTGRKPHFDAKEPVGFDKTKVECFNCHNTGHFAREYKSKGNQESRRKDAGNTGYKAKDNERRPRKQEEPKALVTLDGDGSDTKVTTYSKECVESYAKLKKLYDEQREQLGEASLEIQAYTQALKKKLLAEAIKEKEELKTKLENIQSSSKGLSKLLNSQMSARDKFRLGYGNQIHEGVLSYENEVLESVFNSRSSDVEDSPMNDRFANVEGMHAVPPSLTGINMPSKSDFGIDESQFTYGPKQSKTSESAIKTSDSASCESNSSVETPEFVPKPAVNEPKAVSKPKVWSDAPIIEEYEETVKEQNTCSPSPKVDKRDWNDLMSKRLGLGYGFTKKACFVCGSFSHLIRDYDFHEKRMAKHVELNKQKVNAARQNLSSQATATSTARKVNTARPIHMTRNKAYLVEYQDYNGGPVAFGGSKGQITGKGKIITEKLDFEDVYFVKELKQFNLFSVSQICDKNKVLFTDSECLVLSPDFKLPDENQVLLRVPRQNNM
ncbi:hypothetical protein Tco_1015540 [Tanacetum coccineum]|uniref:Retrovirus-related Pol polyprotein from transposon TNT 1-94-like beta-barrel domain-containing protein n=1 Tax=Tanacetum coccineum TaxID=301880 RepID=A0ABQ5FL70_9ASTR